MSPRETIDFRGRPMQPERFQTLLDQAEEPVRERLFTEKSDRSSFEVWSKAVEEFLSRVNMVELQNIFEEIGAKSGVSPEKLNFNEAEVVVEDFKKLEESGSAFDGFYSPHANKIFLDAKLLVAKAWIQGGQKQKTKGHLIVDENLMFANVLHTMIHEKVHAISYNRLEEQKIDSIVKRAAVWVIEHMLDGMVPVRLGKSRGGYSEHDRTQGSSSSRFRLFDEAVTERLTRDIMKKYLLRCHGETYTPQTVKDVLDILEVNDGYKKERKFLDEVIVGMAQYLKMSETDVWNAIVRSKIEGMDLDDPDVKPVFDAVGARENLSESEAKKD
ncbi:MAG: hypothetical protein A2538_01240 [Candidatus Magasanikbacteria bacterium RIFOXYD2_FULL_41_14]|uniref:Uncharacterized protein n=1 Tax=Candidatus Magasanikbacteria bacterium RIFOXYD2_FULL_41_14 TaxID=1798709 RepID=A0A1F6PCH5_9BACT|nr:MAG: hypothetical protein A2538_01240 [Candidatus Magasanikbacteria bacterium RIFOXYD2_FULL_41_14]